MNLKIVITINNGGFYLTILSYPSFVIPNGGFKKFYAWFET